MKKSDIATKRCPTIASATRHTHLKGECLIQVILVDFPALLMKIKKTKVFRRERLSCIFELKSGQERIQFFHLLDCFFMKLNQEYRSCSFFDVAHQLCRSTLTLILPSQGFLFRHDSVEKLANTKSMQQRHED